MTIIDEEDSIENGTECKPKTKSRLFHKNTTSAIQILDQLIEYEKSAEKDNNIDMVCNRLKQIPSQIFAASDVNQEDYATIRESGISDFEEI